VVGSRDYTDADQMLNIISGLPRDTVIVSGGAPGADTIATSIAESLGMETKVWEADWAHYGNKAGFLRNRQICADIDRLIAFFGPNGVTEGTKHTVNLAMEMRIPIAILFQRDIRSQPSTPPTTSSPASPGSSSLS
jgi:hypothetical protein